MPKRIIIVDDNELDRKTCTRALKNSTLKDSILIESNTGSDALRECKIEMPDCILIDYNLPDMSGLDLLNKITNMNENNKVSLIMMTGQGDEHFAAECIQYDIDDYLIKGEINPEKLISSIKSAITKHEMRNKIYEQKLKLEKIAAEDPLTSLLNRRAFNLRAEEILSQRERHNRLIAFLLIDVNDFKTINDTWGHDVGDSVLQHVSEILKNNIRKEDVVARIGGDEFMIVLQDLQAPLDAGLVAQKIINESRKIFNKNDISLNIGLSIGIAISPTAGTDLKTLMKSSDLALYKSKSMKINKPKFYTERLNKEYRRQTRLESCLNKAISDDKFHIAYQPQINIHTNEIVGIEALLRWEDQELGPVSPVEFIPFAENRGLIIPIGELVLQKTLNDFHKLRENHDLLTNFKVAINIAPQQLLTDHFSEKVSSLLTESNIPPENLELEITETSIMDHFDQCVSILSELSDQGIQIAIDDFGTGYSSLSRLVNMPVNVLKIDRSFIHEIDSHEVNQLVVKSVIAMVANLGIVVVAEGVETEKELEKLLEYKCDLVQGFYYHKPMSFTELNSLLRE